MSRTIKTTALTAALAMALGAGTATALEQGDILVRGGVGHIDPSGESETFGGNYVEADSGTTFAFTVSYMVTDRFGVELLGSAPFNHDIDGGGGLSGLGEIGETKHLPPTLMAQYYFKPSASVRPYVGIGVNYTTFFDEDLNDPALSGLNLDLEDSVGLAFQAGVDIDITDRLFVNGSVWYMNIDTDASLSDGVNPSTDFEVAIDPVVLFAGIGYRF